MQVILHSRCSPPFSYSRNIVNNQAINASSQNLDTRKKVGLTIIKRQLKKYYDRGNKDKTKKSFIEIGKSQYLPPKETSLQKLSQEECFITKFKCQHGAEIFGKLEVLLSA